MGVRDDGKPDRRTVKRQSESAVIQAVRELERQRATGKTRKPGRAWTLEQWLMHWLENIMVPSVRPKTAARYRTDVVEYLIPGLGAHRIDKLQPEHIEKLYAKLRDRKPPLSSSSIYHVHATLRASLNEAMRRKHIVENPVLIARSPQLVEPEIVPLTVTEAQHILDTASTRRNGVRFALALAVGLRQGEAIGLKWTDLDTNAGTLTVRRALQRQTWRHGCNDPHTCGKKRHKVNPCRPGCKLHTRACPPPCPPNCIDHARHCHLRQGGGLVEVDTKSQAGRRIVSVPKPLRDWLERHSDQQEADRQAAGTLWQDDGWIFTQLTGKPIDPRADYQEWRDLLTAAGVRAARLHDARHTAATMLLVLKVPVRAVMDVMGWSEASMASRYMHVPDELKHEIAGQVAGLLWSTPAGPVDAEGERTELTDDQKAAIRLIASALPPYWRRRFWELLGDDDGGLAGVPVPA
jgi:integrase